jgi:hypothetical protein
MKAKKNLSRDTVRVLRKVQKFLIEEPRRFNMYEGITDALGLKDQLEVPPCGTACCIAGAIYLIDTKTPLPVGANLRIGFGKIEHHIASKFKLSDDMMSRLFYQNPYSCNQWPKIYTDAYMAAKTPLERACIGVARIEHFIATDGQE